jgi:hypothetical protein
MPAARPQKITFGEMRDEMGVRAVLVYCADYHCSHSVALSAIAGLTTCGCQISSRALSAPPAAGEGRGSAGLQLQ